MWEDLGGTAVIVTDIGLLLSLTKRNSKLKRHLSLLEGVYNPEAAAFFAGLGVSRIILPRDLSIKEIASVTSSDEEIEYEALVLNQKCQFIDGMCSFYHGSQPPGHLPGAFEYEHLVGQSRPVAWSHDPDYEGHGCEIAWKTDCGLVQRMPRDDFLTPHCAVCLLKSLVEAGVRFLKIAGRGYPIDVVARSVRFIDEAAAIWEGQPLSELAAKELRLLYTRTFGKHCEPRRCYYSSG